MKPLVLAMLVAMLAQGALAQDGARDNPLIDGQTWQELRDDFVPSGTDVRDGAALFTVDAPYRANDAATVPVVIRQVDPTVTLKKAQVIIDENPAPMAADLIFGDRMQPVDFELRVRVDQYSNVRVLATTEAGTFMSGRFVKASGGCSAPATKDPTAALASMGQMRLKHFDSELKGWEEKDETVDFKLVKLTPDKVFFDGLTFERISDNEINVYVRFESEGANSEGKFNYHRIKP